MAESPLFEQALVRHQAGDLTHAQGLYEQLLAAEPEHLKAKHNLGALRLAQGAIGPAVTLLQEVIQADPGYASAYSNLGYAFLQARRFDQAIAACRRAVELQPSLVDAYTNLADAYAQTHRYEEAARWFLVAFSLHPDSAGAAMHLYHAQRHLCDWRRALPVGQLAETLLHEQLERPVSGSPMRPFYPAVFYDDPALQLRSAERYSEVIARPMQGWRQATGGFLYPAREPDARIRLGYLTGDVYDHATMHLIRPLFGLHDRERFEVSVYSYGPPDSSPYRRQAEAEADRFVDISGLGDEAAAGRIHADGIDILIDLKGHTAGSRSAIGAARPAPLQMHWLGFAGSMGAAWIDYVIADGVVIPPGEEGYYREQVLRLPASYLMQDQGRAVPEGGASRAEFRLPEEALVLASFNSPYKVDAESFGAWMRILQALPHAVLWMYVTSETAVPRLQQAAVAAGVAPARLFFTGPVHVDAHIRRMAVADLVLDSFLCNGHTTTGEALWAGVPVLTRYGKHFMSRVAASLLTAAGLEELICADTDAYVARAVELGTQPRRLSALRHTLALGRSASALFDSAAFVRKLEAAYAQAWQRHLRGLPPISMDVETRARAMA